jgi:serine/threonine protein kinase
MALTVASHAEILPGYRLLEPLGRGGFGEVWKAEAPGGLHKAVKILFGNMFEGGVEPTRIRQELKALHRVRTVRHPFILSLERFEVVEGRLIIVTELADKSLWDRFKECRAEGLCGIPREELLRYMEETAEALDLMNGQFNLQHLDIKPQNIFLLFRHVKVGDFGLVKALEGMQARVSSGVTPVYAAPETFDGIVSRCCDQYNLGIVYQELLTGQLPFNGTTGRQLMMQHTVGEPDLRPLPVTDQPAVRKALAKKPEERHAGCMDFVQALRRAGESGVVVDVVPAASLAARDGDDPNAATLPARPFRTQSTNGSAPGSASDTPTDKPQTYTEPAPTPPPPEQPETIGPGVLFPAVVLGVGGLAREVQQHLRQALRKRGGPAETWPHIRLLHLDTDPTAVELTATGEAGALLAPEEILLTFFQRPAHYLRRPRERRQLEEWLPLAPLARLPRDQVTAGGWRALGRLAYLSCAATIAARVRDELNGCTQPEALQGTVRRTNLGLRTTMPRVYIVSSLTGGTGSGMFIDLAYGMRRVLVQLGFPRAEVIGVLLLPGSDRQTSPPVVANTYAALTELNHYAAKGGYASEADARVQVGPPFSRCVLLPLPARTDGPGAMDELAALAGDYLCRDLTTPLGRVADERRAALRLPPASMPCQSFATYWFSVPRRPLLQRAAQLICERLLRRWQITDAAELNTVATAWVADRLQRWELSAKCLTARLTAACGQILGQTPADYCADLMARWAKDGPADLARQSEAAQEALNELVRQLGPPDRDIDLESGTPLLKALAAANHNLANQAEDQLGDVPLRALVEAQLRFSGAEEAVQHQVWTALGEAARRQQTLSADLRRRAKEVYRRLPPHLEALRQRGGYLRRSPKGPAAAELCALFQEYLAARWDSAVARVVGRLCLDLQSNLHKYRRTVECCRPRTLQFLKALADVAAPAGDLDLGLGRYLLPDGCQTLDEAVARLLAGLTPADEEELHEKARLLVGEALLAHVHVCTAPPGLFKDLKEAINREVEQVAQASLGRAHAAEVYLEQHAEDPAVHADLAAAFDQAQPEIAGSRLAGWQELAILAVPPDREGERFRRLVHRALPEAQLLDAASTDDVVFYRENAHVLLTELPQLGLAAREVYLHVLATEPFGPHSRTDLLASLHGRVPVAT